MRFTDRRHAGRALAQWLRAPTDTETWPYGAADPLVLALPRGGVPVAAEVAQEFRAPLDVLVDRKI
ncbi:phosphoribosyltransferase, partial [Streptomyces chrestomyceticus]